MDEDRQEWNYRYRRALRQGAVIETLDGRVGTITYHFLDGFGGIWGDHPEIANCTEDDLPVPEFMLRDADMAQTYAARNEICVRDVSVKDARGALALSVSMGMESTPVRECVGETCYIISEPTVAGGSPDKISQDKIPRELIREEAGHGA